MKLLYTLLLSSIFGSGYGQSPNNVPIGTRDTLQSKILNEKRPLLIYLPDHYSSGKKYPVIYLLDGDMYFHSFTGVVSHLSNVAMIPEMIVVGIPNTNRGRDLTPSSNPDSHPRPNGGGELFTSFIEKELIPYIELNYSTAPYRMLAGHSLGGLLATNTLFRHTNLFNSYMLLDPATWWNNMKLLNESTGVLDEQRFNDKTVFLATSHWPMDSILIRKDTTNVTIGARSILRLHDMLKYTYNKNIKWAFQYYDNETHASLPLVSSYDALRFIFDFYKRPSFPALTDSTVTILEAHYKKLSTEMGYTILPDESDLRGLAWRARVLDNNYERAMIFLRAYEKIYPKSPEPYFAWSEYWEAKGDTEQAREYYQKGSQLRSIIQD